MSEANLHGAPRTVPAYLTPGYGGEIRKNGVELAKGFEPMTC